MSKEFQHVLLIGVALLVAVIGCSNTPRHGAGLAPGAQLEFHVLVGPDEIAKADLHESRHRLETLGPAVQPGDTTRWFEASRPKSTYGISGIYQGKTYVLVWITPEKSMDHRSGTPGWSLRGAYTSSAQGRETVVGFTFDPVAAKLFGDLTQNNLKKPLGIVVANKIVSAPTIQSRITESGIIDGGAEGFTHEELDYLVNTLNGAPTGH